jgi:hypothetical protein
MPVGANRSRSASFAVIAAARLKSCVSHTPLCGSKRCPVHFSSIPSCRFTREINFQTSDASSSGYFAMHHRIGGGACSWNGEKRLKHERKGASRAASANGTFCSECRTRRVWAAYDSKSAKASRGSSTTVLSECHPPHVCASSKRLLRPSTRRVARSNRNMRRGYGNSLRRVPAWAARDPRQHSSQRTDRFGSPSFPDDRIASMWARGSFWRTSLPVARVRSTRQFYRLSAAAAVRIERQVRNAVHDWQTLARQIGVSRREIERLETVIDPALDV